MITQQEFVADCYLDYATRGLEPGNSLHGDWEKAHYPVPRKESNKWVWLLREHHAIQGVIQSEELNRPCIFGGEDQYLVGEWEWLQDYYKKWKSELSRYARSFVSSEQSAIAARRVKEIYGEKQKEWLRRAGQLPKTYTEEGKEKLRQNGKNFDPELRSQNMKKTNSYRMQCTVTGYISTPGGLSRYQQARGIDTSNRVQL
jgi:hypothetical protein